MHEQISLRDFLKGDVENIASKTVVITPIASNGFKTPIISLFISDTKGKREKENE